MPAFTDLFGTVIPAQLNTPAQATLVAGDRSQSFPVVVTLRFDDNAGYLVADYFCIYAEGDDPTECAGVLSDAFNSNEHVQIQFDQTNSASNLTATVLSHNLLAVTLGAHGKGTLLIIQGEVRTGSDRLHAGRLCIPDFPLFTGQGAITTAETTYSHAPSRRSWQRMGYVETEFDDWRVIIAQSTEPSPLAHSHDVHVSKKQGSQFTVEEYNHLVGALSHFLTFVAGTTRLPHVSVGYENGWPTYGYPSLFKQSAYVADNWFNAMEGESIAALLPLFWKRHTSHGESLDRQIELYAESSIIAHTGLHQHALPISQSALEHIAETEIGKMPHGVIAREHIKRALQGIGISTNLSDFPEVLSIWKNLKQPGDDDQGPTFITRLRNSIHPRTGTNAKQPQPRDFYHAWRLSQYYVETALLKLCNYAGKYRNRVTAQWTTESEQVPWAPRSEGSNSA